MNRNHKWLLSLSLIVLGLVCAGIVTATPTNPRTADRPNFGTYTVFDSGAVVYPLLNTVRVVDYITTTASRTILDYESGTVFTVSESSNDPVTFVLPAAEAGLTFTFVDMDATAAADLTIDPATGDKINNGTAGVTYNATGDAFGETVTLTAVDGTNWVLTSSIGTWGAGS